MRDYHLVVLTFWMLSPVKNSVLFLRWAFTEKSEKVVAVLFFFSLWLLNTKEIASKSQHNFV